jgi:hypothetical protein
MQQIGVVEAWVPVVVPAFFPSDRARRLARRDTISGGKVEGKTLPLVFQDHTRVHSFLVAMRRLFVAGNHASCAHPCIANDSADALVKALQM